MPGTPDAYAVAGLAVIGVILIVFAILCTIASWQLSRKHGIWRRIVDIVVVLALCAASAILIVYTYLTTT